MAARGRAQETRSQRREAVLAGVPDRGSVRLCFCRYSEQTQPRESGKWQTPHPTTWNACLRRTKRGLPKTEGLRAMSKLQCEALNIRHGNRVPVVVREWESHSHGEGEQ